MDHYVSIMIIIYVYMLETPHDHLLHLYFFSLHLHSTKPKVSIVYPPRDTIRQGFIKQRAKFKSLDSYPALGRAHAGKISLAKPKHHSYDEHAEIAEEGTEGTTGQPGVEARCYAGKTDAIMPSDAGLSKKDSANRFPSLPTLPAMVRGCICCWGGHGNVRCGSGYRVWPTVIIRVWFEAQPHGTE